MRIDDQQEQEQEEQEEKLLFQAFIKKDLSFSRSLDVKCAKSFITALVFIYVINSLIL